jgi:N-methylhydantoinase A
VYWIGFDVGGTFVDILAIDTVTAEIHVLKQPSSRVEPAKAVSAGLQTLFRDFGVKAGDVARLAHGTTLVTNQLVEHAGAKVGVVTTKGFRDVLEIGRMRRPSLYDLSREKVSPLVGRQARVEVNERIDAEGTVIRPLDESEFMGATAQLIAGGSESIAICFLHSYVNPEHEEAAGRLLERAAIPYSISSKVSAEYGEYERFTTAVVNSYVMPALDKYIDEVADELDAIGVRVPLQIMQSNGGVVPASTAREFPARLINSGPSAGVNGATILASRASRKNLITLDMGGTSTDVSLVVASEPAYVTEQEVEGYPVRAVGTDIRSIGAGGGSIARLDRVGSLQLGPDSAGANPGPACYDLGGTYPTVTDVDLVLGYLDPLRFCAGRQSIDVQLAEDALEQHVAGPRGVTVDQAAVGILKVCITNIVGAVRNITTEQGYDPRDFTLVAFGGAGPIHASLVAKELDIPEVLVLQDPGLLSAKGLLLSNYRCDTYRTYIQPLLDADCDKLTSLFDRLEVEAREQLGGVGVSAKSVAVRRILELCYEGQQYVVPVTVGTSPITREILPEIAQRFDQAFQRLYGFIPKQRNPQILHARVFVEVALDVERILESNDQRLPSLTIGLDALRTERSILLPDWECRRSVPVYDRNKLAPSACFDGPCIIEEDYSNTIVCDGQRVRVDSVGNLLITRGN